MASEVCKLEAFGETVLPDMSISDGQKLIGLKNSNETFWVIFKQCVTYRITDIIREQRMPLM